MNIKTKKDCIDLLYEQLGRFSIPISDPKVKQILRDIQRASESTAVRINDLLAPGSGKAKEPQVSNEDYKRIRRNINNL